MDLVGDEKLFSLQQVVQQIIKFPRWTFPGD